MAIKICMPSGVNMFQEDGREEMAESFSLPPIMCCILTDIFPCVFQISNQESSNSYDCADGSHSAVQSAI